MPTMNGSLIRALLGREALTREDFADIAGVSVGVVDKALASRSVAAASHEKLATALRVPTSVLLLSEHVAAVDLEQDATGIYSLKRNGSTIDDSESVGTHIADMKFVNYGRETCGFTGTMTPVQARQTLERVERTLAENDDPSQLRVHGAALAVAGFHRKAAQLFERAVEHDPNDHCSLLNLGTCLCVLGRLGDSDKAYLKALQVNPDSAWILRTYEELRPHVTKEVDHVVSQLRRVWRDNDRKLQSAINLVKQDSGDGKLPLDIVIDDVTSEITDDRATHVIHTNGGVVLLRTNIREKDSFEAVYSVYMNGDLRWTEFQQNLPLICDRFGVTSVESDVSSDVAFLAQRFPIERIKPAFIVEVLIRGLLLGHNIGKFVQGKDFWDVSIDVPSDGSSRDRGGHFPTE